MIVTNYEHWQKEFYWYMDTAKDFFKINPNLSAKLVKQADGWKLKMETATVGEASELVHLPYYEG